MGADNRFDVLVHDHREVETVSPSAPSTPPANQVLAPGAVPVDRIRDAVSGRPTSPSDV